MTQRLVVRVQRHAPVADWEGRFGVATIAQTNGHFASFAAELDT